LIKLCQQNYISCKLLANSRVTNLILQVTSISVDVTWINAYVTFQLKSDM